MMRRRESLCLICALLTLIAVLPLAALVEPENSAIRDKSFRHADLYIGNRYVPATEVAGARVAEDLARLGVDPTAAYMDQRSGRWGTLMPVEPLLPGDGQGNQLSWEQMGSAAPRDLGEYRELAWNAFLGYLSQYHDELGIDVGELVSPGSVTVHNGGDLVQIHARRLVGGVPVRGSFITATVSHGNLILLGATKWGEVGVSPLPSITSGTAIAVANGYLGTVAEGAEWPKSSLVVVPMAKGADLGRVALGDGYGYRLAWALHPRFSGDALGDWETLIDAHSGELIAFEDKTNYASEGGTGTTRVVEGGVYPVSNDGVGDDGTEQAGYPMPFADVTNAGNTTFTDAAGNLLACVEGDLSTTLNGRYMRMIDTCGPILEAGSDPVLDLGTSGGTDCVVPIGASAGNTHASRSGFYELNRSIEWGRSHLPGNPWLRQQLPATMNIDANCNASGGSGGVNFFTSGGGCSNTGEIAGVFVHEWGHGMDSSDATLGVSNPGEGIADIYASLRLNTSCIGRNFRPGSPCGGYGDPCNTCTGVRDIDWANRASSVPHDIAFIDAACGGGPAPCGGSVHCEGAVYAEAVWDLWQRDLPCHGIGWDIGTGTCVGGVPPVMTIDITRELATRLTFVGAGGVGNWFSCVNGTGVGDGCNADSGYLQYVAADDDGDGLGNGTPHMQAIFDAFDRHGISCPTPTVTDFGCADTPTAAPVVTATPLDRGTELTWPAVAGAASYRVFRTEGVHDCDFGKIWVGDTTELSFIDSELKNGQEHYYIVTAMGSGDTCFGPASSCTTVTPAPGQNLAIDLAGSGAVAITVGDGDAFLDNCEEGAVTVGVANIGTAIQTNVRIVDVRPVDHPEIDITTTLPLVVSASMSACDVATADVDFYADGLDLGDVVDFEVDVTSDELSPEIRTQTVRLAIAGAESDLQTFASRTFSFEVDGEDWQLQQGTFDRTTTGAGSGGGTPATDFYRASSGFLPGQCDHIRSPVMALSATSTMSLWTNFNIEDNAGGAGPWYDRANVGVYDVLSGSRTHVTPSTGRAYNAGGANGSCGTSGQDGWAGTMQTWASSSFDAAALGSAGIAGDFVQLDIRYGTDSGLHLDGFWFDQVTVTDVDLQVADANSNVCGGFGSIFFDGFESGDTSVWSSTSP